MNLVTFLLEPFSYPFMLQALLALVAIGVTSGITGVFVVSRRMAFLGDALAHTALPGVVVAFLLGQNLFLGALVASVVTGLMIGAFSRGRLLQEDTAIGIAFTGMFALGIALMSSLRTFRDLTHVLFGNILAVTEETLGLIVACSAGVLAALYLLRKELVWTTVDPVHAATLGLSPDLVRTILLALLSVVVTVGISAAGVVLTAALLVTPPAAAGLMTRRLGPLVVLSATLAVGSGVTGLYASYYLGISSGAAIVLSATLAFGLVWAIKTVKEGAWNVRRANVRPS